MKLICKYYLKSGKSYYGIPKENKRSCIFRETGTLAMIFICKDNSPDLRIHGSFKKKIDIIKRITEEEYESLMKIRIINVNLFLDIIKKYEENI